MWTLNSHHSSFLGIRGICGTTKLFNLGKALQTSSSALLLSQGQSIFLRCLSSLLDASFYHGLFFWNPNSKSSYWSCRLRKTFINYVILELEWGAIWAISGVQGLKTGFPHGAISDTMFSGSTDRIPIPSPTSWITVYIQGWSKLQTRYWYKKVLHHYW